MWVGLALLCAGTPSAWGDFRVLAFSKTAGFRHDMQISAGQQALTRLAAANGFAVDFSQDEQVFTPSNLALYDVVLFLFTSGDILGPAEESAFEAFVTGGGGFVGIHSATDTEYDWSFYGALVAAYFSDHPPIQTATVVVTDANHLSTAHLAPTFSHNDEWYNFATDPAQNPNVRILLELDESTYTGGTMGASHPIAWTQDSGAGRMWYTAMGHTLLSDADYQNSFFDQHLLGGIVSVVPEPGPGSAAGAALLALAALAGTRCPRLPVFYRWVSFFAARPSHPHTGVHDDERSHGDARNCRDSEPRGIGIRSRRAARALQARARATAPRRRE